jgi:hypothetical protein
VFGDTTYDMFLLMVYMELNQLNANPKLHVLLQILELDLIYDIFHHTFHLFHISL